MWRKTSLAAGLAASLGAAAAYAVPQAIPTYTFCEEEDNDLCVLAQEIDASLAVAMTGNVEEVRDCFYITGKLQEDCVWDRQPKCAMRAFGKPEPARGSDGRVINGEFCEPLVATSVNGRILGLAPNSDGTIRLAVGITIDALDGTVNGLGQNEPHGDTGEVTIKVFCEGDDDGPARGLEEDPDFEYVFRFVNGSDGLRVAFECDSAVESVDIHCCDDTGTIPVCYDVDFYNVTNLIPGRAYCVTVVGGQTPSCEKTDTKLGWFDKNCNMIGGIDGYDDDSGNPSPYSNLCVFADGDGALRFGVTGGAEGPSFFTGEGGTFNDTGNNQSGALVSEIFVEDSGPIDDITVCLKGFRHEWIGDVIATLIHKDTGTKIKFISNVGNPIPTGGDGYDGNVDGEYCFNEMADEDFEDAAAANSSNGTGSHGVIPPGTYRSIDPENPDDNLTAFIGEDRQGTWCLILEDTFSEEADGAITEWCLSFGTDMIGDCNFNGLEDSMEEDYFFFLVLLDVFEIGSFEYRPGASTKDDTIDQVIRYPRRVWNDDDGFLCDLLENMERFDVEHCPLDAGRTVESFFDHGVCGGYCIKIQLAEHVDPSERPTFPPITVGGAGPDMNNDGFVNASDLAALLSHWGIVTQ